VLCCTYTILGCSQGVVGVCLESSGVTVMRCFFSSVLARRVFRVMSLWLVLAQIATLPAGAAPARPQAQAAAPRFRAAAPASAPTDPTPLGPPNAPPELTSERPHASIAPTFGSTPAAGSHTRLPAWFAPNVGQTDAQVRFLTNNSDGTIFFTADTVVFALTAPLTPTTTAPRVSRLPREQGQKRSSLASVIRLRWLGATSPTLQPAEQLSGTLSIATPRIQADHIPTYGALDYQHLYPGIDLRFDRSAGTLKGTYTVAPGADPDRIRWRYQGTNDIRLDETGNLVLTVPASTVPLTDSKALTGTLVEAAPHAWQDLGGQRIPVAVRYDLAPSGIVRFVLSAYDHSRPLTIDPTILYQTYLGGSSTDSISDLAVAPDGSVYLTGVTRSSDFPGAASATPSSDDAFVAHLSADGTSVTTSIFGGDGDEQSRYITVDKQGSAYVVGTTGKDKIFPVTSSFSNQNPNSPTQDWDVFVAKIQPNGATVYRVRLGGGLSQEGRGVAVDAQGSVYVLALLRLETSHDYPYPLYPYTFYTPSSPDDVKGFASGTVAVTKLSPDGTTVVWSSFTSGISGGAATGLVPWDLAIDDTGALYLTGQIDALSDFPIVPAGQNINSTGGTDVFVQKLTPDGSHLRLSTVYGGSKTEYPYSIAVTSAGGIVVAGSTASSDLPATAQAAQSSQGGGDARDVFVVRWASGRVQPQFATYIGGWGDSEGMYHGLGLDHAGQIYIAANGGQNYPRAGAGSTLTLEGPALTILSADGRRFLFSGHIPFKDNRDWPTALGVRADRTVVLAGNNSDGVTLTGSGVQHTPFSGENGFVLAVRDLLSALPDDQESCPCDRPPMAVKPQPNTALPINTRTGTFWTRATDLHVETPGVDLTWSRSYVSRVITDTTSGLGAGWQHPFADRLTLPNQTGGEVGTAVLLTANGNRHRFSIVSGGVFVPWPGVPSTLTLQSGVYILTLPDQSERRFDTNGRLISVRDPQGRSITLTYDGSGHLTRIGDATRTSRALTLTWSSGTIASVSDGSRTVQYTYAQGDLVQMHDVMNRPTSYTYQGHLLTSITNALGQVTEAMVYDHDAPNGRVVQQTLLDGQVLQFQYLPATTVITTTGADGRTNVDAYDYDDANTLRGVRHNGGSILGTTFDSNFAPGEARDGNNHATETLYDEQGRLRSVTDALGNTTTYLYNTQGDMVSTTDPLGVSVYYTYDDAHRLTQETRGVTTTSTLRAITSYHYTGDLLDQVTAPDGVITHSTYNADGQLTQVTEGYGTAQARTTAYGYDALGRRSSVTTGAGTLLARTDVTEYNADNTVARSIANYGDGVFDPLHPDQDVITTYGYDALGRPSWVRDALGHVTATGYNTIGQVAWTTSNLVQPGWSGGALPTNPPTFSPAHPDQNVSAFYGYDSLGRTILITQTGFLTGTFDLVTRTFSDATVRVERQDYDAYGRVATSTLNPSSTSGADRNVETHYAYDGAGNPTWVQDPLGRLTATVYTAANQPKRVIGNYVDNLPFTGTVDTDLVSELRYDALGRLTIRYDNAMDGVFTATQPITDRTTLYQYDTLGRVITTTVNYEPTGVPNPATNRKTVQAYDPSTGRLLGTRDALGSWDHVDYDALGQVTQTVQNCRTAAGAPAASGCAPFSTSTPDRNLVAANYGYDTLGRLRTETDVTGLVSETRYDGLGRVTTQVLNPQAGQPSTALVNIVTQTSVNALGQTTHITDPLGHVAQQGYDGLGRTTVLTDALGHVTRGGYDADGVLRWRQGPDGDLTVTLVDGVGHARAVVAHYQDGVVGPSEASDTDLISSFTYDQAGRVTQQVEPDGHTTHYRYDLMDHLIEVVENAASITCSNPPCNATTRYTYDRAGNQVAITDARGNVRRFTYNAADELVYTSGAADSGLIHEYDTLGRLVSTTDPRGGEFDLSYSYDGLGHLTELRTFATLDLHWRYNARGQRIEMQDASGTTSYQYDVLGRLSQVDQPGGSVGYSYDARGLRTGVTYPNGSTLSYRYTANGALEQVQQGLAVLASYQYDAAGRPTQVTRANGSSTSWSYDQAGRLTAIDSAGTTPALLKQTYQYDRAGQLVQKKDLGTSGQSGRAWRYTYDGLRRLTQVEQQDQQGTPPVGGYPFVAVEAYGYDLAGNRTDVWRKLPSETFAYTAHYDYDAKNRVMGWSYDAAGNLIGDGQRAYTYDALNRLTDVSVGATSTHSTYNGDGLLMVQQSGTAVTTYTQDVALGLPQVLQTKTGASITTYGYGLERLFQAQVMERLWYTADAQGSVQHLLSDQGAVLNSTQYDAWGRPKSALSTPFGFTGELQDQSTGLVYLRARWYDPNTGTFTGFRWAADESWDNVPYSHHPYAYALSNPLQYTDPSGRFACALGLAGGPPGWIAAAVCTLVTYVGAAIAGAVIGTGLACATGAICAHTNPPSQAHYDGTTSIPTPGPVASSNKTRMTPSKGSTPVASAPHGQVQQAPTPVPFPAPDTQKQQVSVFPQPTECLEAVIQPGPVALPKPTGIPVTEFPTPTESGPIILESRAPSQKLLANIIKSTPSLKTTSRRIVNADFTAHHLIPDESRRLAIVSRAKAGGWDHDEAYNGLLIPRNQGLSQQYNLPFQRTNHNNYTRVVEQVMNNLEAMAIQGSWTGYQSTEALKELATEIRFSILQAGGGIPVDSVNISHLNANYIKTKLNLP
jgi:RHS repeat-associated protein